MAGKAKTAEDKLLRFQAKYPDDKLNAYVLTYLGDIAMDNVDTAAAVKCFRECLERFPDGRLQDDCRFGLARALERRDQYDEAERLYRAVAGKPENTLADDAQFHLAVLLYITGKYTASIETYSAFETKFVESRWRPKARLGRGWALMKLGRLKDAESAFRELFDTPGVETEISVEAGYWLGMVRREQEDWPGAAETFEKLLAKDPPAEMAAEAALVRGRILQRLRLSDQALIMYDMVIEKYPKSRQHPQALLSAARLRAELRQLSDSAALYERFVEQYPDTPQLESALYQWAWVLSDQGKQSESAELFERLRKNYGQRRYGADATFRLAQRALDAKDYQRAGKMVDEVLAGRPDDRTRENAMYLRGRIAVAQEQWRQVAGAFEALLEAFPETSNKLQAEFWIAEATYRQEDYQQAARLFDQLAEQIRGRPEQWLAAVLLRQAQILSQKGDWSGAYAIASKIEAKYPNFKQLHEADYLIGRCRHARADFQGARGAFRKVIRSKTGEKTETAAMAQWMIGETFFHQKDYKTALRAYLRMEILYDYPTWQAAALLQAGKCREKLGQRHEAAKLYKRVLKVYPDTIFAKMAEKRAADNPANSLTPEAGRVRRR